MAAKKQTTGAKKKGTTRSRKASTAGKTDTKRPAARPRSQKKFIRNTSGVEFRMRLERHGKDKKPILLQPRGWRGDIAPVSKDDLNDPVLLDNLTLGYVELITEAEAKEAITKQGINIQAAHPALAALRNPEGEEYPEGALKVTEAFEEQGTVVAELDDGQVVFDHQGIAGRTDPTAIDNADANKESPIRTTAINPADLRSPGVAGAQGGGDPAEAADALARNKQAQGPAAGLGGIKRVTVGPTKKTE